MKNKVKYKGKGFAGVKSGEYNRKSWDAQLEAVRWTSQYADKTTLIRIVSPLFPVATHWVYTSLEDLGKNNYSESLVGKRFMVTCPDWNPEEEQSSATTCYICKHLTKKEYLGKANIQWYVQAFVAKKKDGKIKWEEEPKVIILPTPAVTEIKTMMETVGNGVEPQDKKHGYAIWLTYKNGGAGKSNWSAQKDSEISFKKLGFDEDDIIDFGEYFEPTTAKDIDETMDRLGYVDFIENGGKKKKSKSVDDDDDDDMVDADTDDDEDDEDEKPSKKKKSKKDDDDDDDDEEPKKKKKNKFEDDDEDDDDSDDEDSDDDDDDDEDEKPSKKKKNNFEDDDDDDSDDEDDEDSDDEDEEDDELKKKKKSKKDDDDDDDEDEDEDEKPKKKKKSKKFDDEDDDDDEPKKKKKKSKKFDDDDDD